MATCPACWGLGTGTGKAMQCESCDGTGKAKRAPLSQVIVHGTKGLETPEALQDLAVLIRAADEHWDEL